MKKITIKMELDSVDSGIMNERLAPNAVTFSHNTRGELQAVVTCLYLTPISKRVTTINTPVKSRRRGNPWLQPWGGAPAPSNLKI